MAAFWRGDFGEILISDGVRLTAENLSAGLTLDAGGNSRLFHITASDGTVSFEDLTLMGGDADGEGGAIFAEGTARILLDGVWMTQNAATTHGGAIFANGPLDIVNATFSENVAADDGGAIFANGQLSVLNSTLSTNAASRGGGIWADEEAMLRHSTVTENSAIEGGGIRFAGSGALSHVIAAGNVGGDVTGALTAEFSLIGDNTGSGIPEAQTADANGNLVGDPMGGGLISPELLPLADNGAATPTHALIGSSPAIDAGDPTLLSGPATDQRGGAAMRIADGGVGGAVVDMGAYEQQSASQLSTFVDLPTDEFDGDYSTGDVSLREAIAAANVLPGTQVIQFAADLAGATLPLDNGELVIRDGVIITAANSTAPIVVDARGASRVMHATRSVAELSIAGLTLRGGMTTADGFAGSGAGILFRGSEAIFLDRMTLEDNVTQGTGAGGGAIASLANVNVTASTLHANSASGDQSEGGGIWIPGEQTLVITSSTLSGNSSTGDGGAMRSMGDIVLGNSTVTRNRTSTPATYGGGIRGGNNVGSMMASVTITSSIVAGNTRRTGAGTDLPHDIVWPNGALEVDHSIIGTRSGTDLVESQAADADGNFIGGASVGDSIDPVLADLADNGGPTHTHLPMNGSPALDAGQANALLFDQRGLARIQDDPALANVGDRRRIGHRCGGTSAPHRASQCFRMARRGPLPCRRSDLGAAGTGRILGRKIPCDRRSAMPRNGCGLLGCSLPHQRFENPFLQHRPVVMHEAAAPQDGAPSPSFLFGFHVGLNVHGVAREAGSKKFPFADSDKGFGFHIRRVAAQTGNPGHPQ